MFKYENMYVDIYAKYYDEKEEIVIKRKVILDVALLMVEHMLAMKKMQWALYGGKVMSMHAIEWVRLD